MLYHRAVRSIIGVLLLLLATLAAADTFTHPPESSTAPGEWVMPYPYPRNATIDFATNPWDPENPWPTDPTDPTIEGDWAKDLIPGVNYDIEGWDDTSLYDGDWWAFSWPSSLLAWHADDPAGSGRTGIFEFYYEGPGPPGTNPAMYWQLSNSSGDEAKRIWLEMVVHPPVDVPYWSDFNVFATVGQPGVPDPDNEACWVSEPELRFSDDLGDGWVRKTWYVEVKPSPDWETIIWNFEALVLSWPGDPDPPSPSWYIDEIHIGTEAVPEPGTVALFGLGLLGLGARLRQRGMASKRTGSP